MGDGVQGRTLPTISALDHGAGDGAPQGAVLDRTEGDATAADGTDRNVRLAAAVALIERDFRRRGISLMEVARAAHFSPYHFHRIFRRRYGKSPKHLIEELRIAEVQRLMLRGVSPRDAAAATGFAHQSHMTTRFRQRVGAPPAQWLAGQQSPATA